MSVVIDFVSAVCQRKDWPSHKLSCMEPKRMPSDFLQHLLDGAEKFVLKYQCETFAVTRLGYQQVKGWWKGPLETKGQFQARFQKATRAFAWAITIRLKHEVGYPKGQLSHSDFAYVPGTGKLVSSTEYGSPEQRDMLISVHESRGQGGGRRSALVESYSEAAQVQRAGSCLVQGQFPQNWVDSGQYHTVVDVRLEVGSVM
ncbi:hypothetical protein BDP27DRAFT_1365944 [Rhodocollybia butyracea]|uniref:Uncharacterized protein n=1 Tax=Rhodocollybia butyracea TaxID=206335 RepID=A0A9P5PPB1_9AGAR|nr:hypothetical protein BDP27DRAFT_1365944 [Rhodocollybia butyracea]